MSKTHQPQIPFTAGMALPVGTEVYTRSRGVYTSADRTTTEARSRLHSRKPATCVYYGTSEEGGYQIFYEDGTVGSEHPQFAIVRVALPVVAPTSAPIFQVGDVVYCLLYGKGKVFSVDDHRIYPVRVNFGDNGEEEYTKGGQLFTEVARTLFFAPLTIDATHLNRPRPVFAPGNVVFNERSGVVSVVSHDSTDSDQTTLFQSGASGGPTFTVSYSQLRLISPTV